MKVIVYWLPRVLAIVFNIFLSVFALDVFGEPQWFLALLIHLVPNFILAALTIIAWRYEKIGGMVFLIAGLVMVSFYHSLIVVIPPLVIGVLFLLGSLRLKKDIFNNFK